MHRGRSIQPSRDCEYCGLELPALRHPKAKYCNPLCRERARYHRKYVEQGVKCLVCNKPFVRVGSHVVQAHGYESVGEYRKEYGLMSKETRLDGYADKMGRLARNKKNLKAGRDNQYIKGGSHGDAVSEFWVNRKTKAGYRELGRTLRGTKQQGRRE